MKINNPRAVAAFTLVEVVLALGIASFCLLPISGLLVVALGSNQAGIEQTSANSVLTAVVSDLQATPSTVLTGGTATSKQYSIAIPASGSTATQTLYFNGDHQLVTTPALGRYRVTVNFVAPPSGGGARSATDLSLKVSWPAPVNPATTTPNGFVQAFVALDRN